MIEPVLLNSLSYFLKRLFYGNYIHDKSRQSILHRKKTSVRN